MRLVEIRGSEQRRVSVSVVASEDRSGVKAFDQVEVPERYVSEPRCRDTRACAERVAAIELAEMAARPEPERTDIEDPMSWL